MGGSEQVKEATAPHVFQWNLSRDKETIRAKRTQYRAQGRDSKAIVLEESVRETGLEKATEGLGTMVPSCHPNTWEPIIGSLSDYRQSRLHPETLSQKQN